MSPNKREYNKQYYLKNKEKALEDANKYYLEHREERISYVRQYREDNIEKCKQYRIDNSKRRIENARIWRENNPEKAKAYQILYDQEHKKERIEWQKNNPEKTREAAKRFYQKHKTNLKYILNKKIKTAIWLSLMGNKNGWHWETLVGYTLTELKEHLEKTMPKGYEWIDYIKGKLHIDHITPISVFNFKKSEHIDFQRCWALENLRLLPARENLLKHNKLSRPFQPALAI